MGKKLLIKGARFVAPYPPSSSGGSGGSTSNDSSSSEEIIAFGLDVTANISLFTNHALYQDDGTIFNGTEWARTELYAISPNGLIITGYAGGYNGVEVGGSSNIVLMPVVLFDAQQNFLSCPEASVLKYTMPPGKDCIWSYANVAIPSEACYIAFQGYVNTEANSESIVTANTLRIIHA